jgi:hypothetical protein
MVCLDEAIGIFNLTFSRQPTKLRILTKYRAKLERSAKYTGTCGLLPTYAGVAVGFYESLGGLDFVLTDHDKKYTYGATL